MVVVVVVVMEGEEECEPGRWGRRMKSEPFSREARAADPSARWRRSGRSRSSGQTRGTPSPSYATQHVAESAASAVPLMQHATARVQTGQGTHPVLWQFPPGAGRTLHHQCKNNENKVKAHVEEENGVVTAAHLDVEVHGNLAKVRVLMRNVEDRGPGGNAEAFEHVQAHEFVVPDEHNAAVPVTTSHPQPPTDARLTPSPPFLFLACAPLHILLRLEANMAHAEVPELRKALLEEEPAKHPAPQAGVNREALDVGRRRRLQLADHLAHPSSTPAFIQHQLELRPGQHAFDAEHGGERCKGLLLLLRQWSKRRWWRWRRGR